MKIKRAIRKQKKLIKNRKFGGKANIGQEFATRILAKRFEMGLKKKFKLKKFDEGENFKNFSMQ